MHDSPPWSSGSGAGAAGLEPELQGGASGLLAVQLDAPLAQAAHISGAPLLRNLQVVLPLKYNAPMRAGPVSDRRRHNAREAVARVVMQKIQAQSSRHAWGWGWGCISTSSEY